jgi:hypothetical protein
MFIQLRSHKGMYEESSQDASSRIITNIVRPFSGNLLLNLNLVYSVSFLEDTLYADQEGKIGRRKHDPHTIPQKASCICFRAPKEDLRTFTLYFLEEAMGEYKRIERIIAEQTSY